MKTIYQYNCWNDQLEERSSMIEGDKYYLSIDSRGREDPVCKQYWFTTPQEAKMHALKYTRLQVEEELVRLEKLKARINKLQKEV